jgi:integrase/recombinase XerD
MHRMNPYSLTEEEKETIARNTRKHALRPGPTPITIFVRHTAACKYSGDEFARRCKCRKHLRWTQNGKQYRQTAGTRSWEEAEDAKRRLEDELKGRTPVTEQKDGQLIRAAVDTFIKDKRVQGVTPKVIGKYTLELGRFSDYCGHRGVLTVAGVTRELLTDYAGTWKPLYPSSTTRFQVRARCRSFLRYCFEAKWIERIPSLPKVKAEEPPTMPLSAAEYDRLLARVPKVVTDKKRAAAVRALFQLMRWSGLAIRDALTLERGEIQHDKAKDLYRIVTARQKTGTHVSVPIRADVAREILAVLNGNPRYVFWSGNGEEESITKSWAKYYIAPAFKAAGLDNGAHMMSHRLRDTFAVDLLEKGVPLEEVSKLLGHESIKTTEKHYAKWVKGRQDRLDSLVMGTWAKKSKRSVKG